MLLTERGGRYRWYTEGKLDSEPIHGISVLSIDQLFDIALHPDFAKNHFVYLTYMKKAPRPDGSKRILGNDSFGARAV